MGFLKAIGEFIAAQMVTYTFAAFIIFTTVVSLLGGISDTVYAMRAEAAQDRWAREAEDRGEDCVREDYTANTTVGAAQFVLLACTVLLGIRLLKRKTGRTGFILLAAATMISAFVFLYPRAAIGTASGRMPEIYAFLTLLGIVDLCTYHGFLRQHDDSTDNTA
jgi:hypothetical protein